MDALPELNVPTSRLGVLLVVSGPSGSGKTSLCRLLCGEGEAVFSISCTTRPPRAYEVEGRDYHFLSEEAFMQKVNDGEFFEWARVHGNLYGTLKSAVKGHLLAGEDVLLDIDVQGAMQVRGCEDELIRRCYADVFILPPSVEVLDQRLTKRGSESPERHALRMHNAISEMEHWPEYRHALISGHIDDDYVQFKALLIAERLKVSRYLRP